MSSLARPFFLRALSFNCVYLSHSSLAKIALAQSLQVYTFLFAFTMMMMMMIIPHIIFNVCSCALCCRIHLIIQAQKSHCWFYSHIHTWSQLFECNAWCCCFILMMLKSNDMVCFVVFCSIPLWFCCSFSLTCDSNRHSKICSKNVNGCVGHGKRDTIHHLLQSQAANLNQMKSLSPMPLDSNGMKMNVNRTLFTIRAANDCHKPEQYLVTNTRQTQQIEKRLWYSNCDQQCFFFFFFLLYGWHRHRYTQHDRWKRWNTNIGGRRNCTRATPTVQHKSW